MRYLVALLALIIAFLALSAISSCSPSVDVPRLFDASPDATELDAAPDANSCPSPNPGQLPCEDALACPVVPIGSCGEWVCPKNDAGLSYCEWVVKDGG